MSDNQVILADEPAPKRRPQLPVQYETAVKALAECRQIEEAKFFADKADALAAWAKIYHSGEADRQARLLKLHAYRRMGELARELRPPSRQRIPSRGPSGTTPVAAPGAPSLLRESGLTRVQADAALKLSRATPAQLEEIHARPTIPTPSTWAFGTKDIAGHICRGLSYMASITRRVSVADFLKRPNPKRGYQRWEENAEEVYEWLRVALRKKPGE